MSLRKSFIKPRPGAYSVADASEKKQVNISMPYGRKLSAKSIDQRDNGLQTSFNVGGRRLAVPSEVRKASMKAESFDHKRQPPKPTLVRAGETKNFGASSGSILQNTTAPESGGGMAQKKSMR